jgi:hypothetical protein
MASLLFAVMCVSFVLGLFNFVNGLFESYHTGKQEKEEEEISLVYRYLVASENRK